MALDQQFIDAMTYVIVVENLNGSSSGGYGGRTFGTAYNVQARIEQFVERRQSHEGREVVTKGRIYCPPFDNTSGQTAISIRPTDRVTIPSGIILAASSQPALVNVEQHNDETGAVMYYEVLI